MNNAEPECNAGRDAGRDADLADAERATRDWIERFVVGLDICPFAGAALRSGGLEIVAGRFDLEGALERFGNEAVRLVERHASGVSRATTVIVLAPHADGRTGFDDFHDYLDLVDIADELIDSMRWRGVLQLASFHPDYRFEGCDREDPANASNRSPYPLLHLLVEDDVESAIAAHPDPEGIPERNVDRLRGLQREELVRLSTGAGRRTDDE